MAQIYDVRILVIVALTAVAVGSVVVLLLFPLTASSRADGRIKAFSAGRNASVGRQSGSGGILEGMKDSRRKQVQELLKQTAGKARRARRKTLRMLILQSGLELSVSRFWLISAVAGVVLMLVAYYISMPWYLITLSGFVGLMGLPRWFLGFLCKRRQETFLKELPDAIDVMVRGLKAGLPLSDAMRVIASETAPPIGPEFSEVVEGQRLGISLEQGLERMFSRMPLQEVNFLAIALSIQSKTGGNLTEALSNLAKVLRERRKMKGKVRSVSQEAKSSAVIIGCLPLLIAGFVSFLNPDYLTPLFSTTLGNALLIGSGIWMLTGILVMRTMINFKI